MLEAALWLLMNFETETCKDLYNTYPCFVEDCSFQVLGQNPLFLG